MEIKLLPTWWNIGFAVIIAILLILLLLEELKKSEINVKTIQNTYVFSHIKDVVAQMESFLNTNYFIRGLRVLFTLAIPATPYLLTGNAFYLVSYLILLIACTLIYIAYIDECYFSQIIRWAVPATMFSTTIAMFALEPPKVAAICLLISFISYFILPRFKIKREE